MSIRFSGIIVLLLLLRGSVNAQLSDTIKYSLQQKPKLFFTLSSFNTFIDHQFANISIVKFGLGYNQRIRFGIAYSNLANNAVVTNIHITENNLDYYTNGRLHFGYVSLSTEYFFYNNYPWQCSFTPFNIGIGSAKFEYINRPDQDNVFTNSETILLYQPQISAQYNIFRWLGIGATTGYRFTLIRSQKMTQNLNAPTFAIEFRLFLDEIYKMMFGKEG